MPMFTTTCQDPNSAWIAAVDGLRHLGKEVPSRNGDTLELSPAVLHIADPRHRLVTAFGRPVNPAFSLAEVLWILSGRKDVAMLQRYNSSIGNYSDDGVMFNAAYGYRLRSEFGFDQLQDMIDGLRLDPGSRQAVLNVWSPEKDRATWIERDVQDERGHSEDIARPNVTKDRACNLMGHALIRDGKLNWTQYMRSNDVMWGTPNNFMQWMHIQEYVAAQLGIPVGTYTHIADSLHVYEQHWGDLPKIAAFDLYDELDASHAPMTIEHFDTIVDAEDELRQLRGILYPDRLNDIPKDDYWHSVLRVFRSWYCYKEGYDGAALRELAHCPDKVLAAAQARYYWWFRWGKTAADPAHSTWPRLMFTSLLNVSDTVADWIVADHK